MHRSPVRLFGWSLSFIGLFIALLAPLAAASAPASRSSRPVHARGDREAARRAFGELPLRFEAHGESAGAPARYVARAEGYTLWLAPDDIRMAFPESSLRMRLIGGHPALRLTPQDELPGRGNYFTANQRRNDVSGYASVRYENVYAGIDLLFYGKRNRPEYDFIVRPGADPRRIEIAFEGARRMRVDAAGDLILETEAGSLTHRKPVAYQERGGRRQPVAARYVVVGTNRVRFEVGAYDRRAPLIIDPVLAYSTFLGGERGDEIIALTLDDEGNIYVAGRTLSLNFPTTAGALQRQAGGGSFDAFVAKLNSAGTALIYATYIGGTDAGGISDTGDHALSIAVDEDGNAYVAGVTSSPNFPVTPGAFQTAQGGGSDAFVLKLNPAGNQLIYATRLGGSLDAFGRPDREMALGIAVDSEGNAVVTGRTNARDFPVMAALRPMSGGGDDAFVAKVNADGTGLIYSTYFGGNNNDGGETIALDEAGDVYISGSSDSTNFPTSEGAFQKERASDFDAFVAKLRGDGSEIVYATFLGGTGIETATGLALDGEGNVYICGQSFSADLPTTEGSFQKEKRGGSDAYVAKFNADGTALIFSTFIGGSEDDAAARVAIDSEGNAYITGVTFSKDFPVAAPVQDVKKDDLPFSDGFAAKLSADGAMLPFSTYLGGAKSKGRTHITSDGGAAIAVTSNGDMIVAGFTGTRDFPKVFALQNRHAGGHLDSFIARIGTPRLLGLALTGKKLTAIGENFGPGAVVLVDGQPLKSVTDAANPTTRVTGKKATRFIAPGQTVEVRVRAANGETSNALLFTR